MASQPEAVAFTERHRLAQLAVRLETVLHMRRLGEILDVHALTETTGPWIALAERLVTVQHDRSAALARAYFRDFRLAELGDAWVGALPEAPVSAEALRTSLLVTGPIGARRDTAAGLDLVDVATRMVSRSAEAAARHALAGGRDGLLGATRTDQRALGWARVTDSDPCAFCAMLASRGPVYRSQQRAHFDAHDSCGCTAEPVYRRDAPWPGQATSYRQLWDQATAGHSGQAAVNAFRRAYEAR